MIYISDFLYLFTLNRTFDVENNGVQNFIYIIILIFKLCGQEYT